MVIARLFSPGERRAMILRRWEDMGQLWMGNVVDPEESELSTVAKASEILSESRVYLPLMMMHRCVGKTV